VMELVDEAKPLVTQAAAIGFAERGEVLPFDQHLAAVRRVEPALVEGNEWQLGEPSQVGARWLASPEAGLWVTYDARTAHLKVEWPDPVAQQVQAMRAKIAELRKEAARRSDTDRRFIEAEIEANERQIKSTEATARPGPFEKPAVLELRDPKGRAYARVTIQSR